MMLRVNFETEHRAADWPRVAPARRAFMLGGSVEARGCSETKVASGCYPVKTKVRDVWDLKCV